MQENIEKPSQLAIYDSKKLIPTKNHLIEKKDIQIISNLARI